MKYRPHEYQQYAISYILDHPVCAILLDMGLGRQNKYYDHSHRTAAL